MKAALIDNPGISYTVVLDMAAALLSTFSLLTSEHCPGAGGIAPS